MWEEADAGGRLCAECAWTGVRGGGRGASRREGRDCLREVLQWGTFKRYVESSKLKE